MPYIRIELSQRLLEEKAAINIKLRKAQNAYRRALAAVNHAIGLANAWRDDAIEEFGELVHEAVETVVGPEPEDWSDEYSDRFDEIYDIIYEGASELRDNLETYVEDAGELDSAEDETVEDFLAMPTFVRIEVE